MKSRRRPASEGGPRQASVSNTHAKKLARFSHAHPRHRLHAIWADSHGLSRGLENILKRYSSSAVTRLCLRQGLPRDSENIVKSALNFVVMAMLLRLNEVNYFGQLPNTYHHIDATDYI